MSAEVIGQVMTYVVGPIVTAVVAYLIGLRKSRGEAQKGEIENLENVARIWRESAESLAEEMKQRLSEKDANIELLQSQVATLLSENKQIMEQNKKILAKIGEVEKDYSKLLTNYNQLKENYQSLKKEIEEK